MKNLRLYVITLLALLVCIVAAVPVVASAQSQRVYIGGFPVGISLDVGGLLVESITGVETEYGTAYVDGFKRGDIIMRIDGVKVESADDMCELPSDRTVRVELWRDGDTVNLDVTPLVEAFSGKARLGVKIKDKIYGIGTMSFIRENGNYAALGHEIYDSETATHIPFCAGKIHSCKILGVKKGENGEAGALLGSLSAQSDYGTVTCNNNFGIAGQYKNTLDKADLVEVADRSQIKAGAAQIRTTVDDKPEYFDIEIIKTSKKHGRIEKGIVFRVTDKRLLNKTGGVVRGMSGSPIVQDGKLIGAVTHVFLNDFTKGYGVFADCMN